MTFKAIVGIVLGAMLANNYALEKFLGAAPLLGWSAQEKKITVLGVSVTVAMVLTALIAGLVQTYVLDKLSLGYLQTLVFAAIVLIVVYAMNAVAKAAFKKRPRRLLPCHRAQQRRAWSRGEQRRRCALPW